MELKAIVYGSGLCVHSSSPEAVTLSGSFDSITFINPNVTDTHFVIGSQKEALKFLKIEGLNLNILKQSDKIVTLSGEIKYLKYKTPNGVVFKTYVVIPCDITVAEVEEF